MTVSDAPNCSVTYDHHHDDRNSFIIQATESSKMGERTEERKWNNTFLNAHLIDATTEKSIQIYVRLGFFLSN